MSNKRPFVGILPAAGLAERLQPLVAAKELLPVGFALDEQTSQVRPVPIAEYAVRAMVEAGAHRCIMVVGEHKTELIRYFGNGSRFGIPMAYVAQPSPEGLAAAITEAAPWVGGANVCLALPDSVFRPASAMARICERLTDTGADLVLGVFPTDTPERFGVVRSEGEMVRAVMEKPPHTDLRNAWGIAAWTPTFTRMLTDSAAVLRTVSITNAFDLAVESGMDVRAVHFDSGQYVDIGTIDSLSALILRGG